MTYEMESPQQVLAALSDPTRQQIVAQLRGGARSVGEIAGPLPVSRPAVSQHLKVLKDAGLVRFSRDGVRPTYVLNPIPFEALKADLEGMAVLAGSAAALELDEDCCG